MTTFARAFLALVMISVTSAMAWPIEAKEASPVLYVKQYEWICPAVGVLANVPQQDKARAGCTGALKRVAIMVLNVNSEYPVAFVCRSVPSRAAASNVSHQIACGYANVGAIISADGIVQSVNDLRQAASKTSMDDVDKMPLMQFGCAADDAISHC